MNQQYIILRDLVHLPKFALMTPKKVYYINHTTGSNTMCKLINLANKKKEFIIQTKCYHVNKYPPIIQILFVYELRLHIVLVETIYLSWNNSLLHNQLQQLFSVILSPPNVIQSWTDIKKELRNFLNLSLFEFCQIEKVRVINIKDQFQNWFRKAFSGIDVNYFPLNDWTLETAMAFLFQRYFGTTLSKSQDWNIGLFLELYPDELDGFSHGGPFVLSLPKPNQYRQMHNECAIHECMALNKIAAIFRISCARKHAENYLKNITTVITK